MTDSKAMFLLLTSTVDKGGELFSLMTNFFWGGGLGANVWAGEMRGEAALKGVESSVTTKGWRVPWVLRKRNVGPATP